MAEITLTKDNFSSEVLEAKLPVLIDFWATWCPPCRKLAPVIEEISKEYAGRIAVGKVNVDEQPELANMFRVSSIPTVVLMKDGKVANMTVGYQEKEALLKALGLSL